MESHPSAMDVEKRTSSAYIRKLLTMLTLFGRLLTAMDHVKIILFEIIELSPMENFEKKIDLEL